MTKSNFFRRTRSLSNRADETRARRRLLIETLDQRMVLASLAGYVFDDLNDTWRQDADESSLGQRLVFADANDNGLPDDGEAFVLTEPDGTFALDDLGADPQIIRLFQAAPSQTSAFPVTPEADSSSISLGPADPTGSAAGLELARLSGDASALLKAVDGAIVINLEAGSSSLANLGSTPNAIAPLADGRWLVLANDQLGNRSFLVGPGTSVEPIDLLGNDAGGGELGEGGFGEGGLLGPTEGPSVQASGWADVAVGGEGTGFVLPTSPDGSPVPLHRLDLSETPPAVSTDSLVSPAARLIAGEGVTTVIAEPTETGLAVSLWSNTTGAIISSEPVSLPGAIRVLAYGEATGLLYVLMSPEAGESGDVIRVLDVAAGFAPLQTITGLASPQAIDTDRGVIYAFDSPAGRLRAVDAVLAETIGDWSLDVVPEETVGLPPGEFTEMSILPGGEELVLFGASVVRRVSLRSVDTHRVGGAGAQTTFPLRFAVRLDGENTPPAFSGPFHFSTFPASPLNLPAGTLLAGAHDEDGDPVVVVRISSPAHGTARITPQGGLSYSPELGFVGIDSFQIILHDGRGASEPTTVFIHVQSGDQQPPFFEVTPRPIPQAVRPGFVVGQVESIGFLGPLGIVVHDPRFEVFGDQILVQKGGLPDYYPGLTLETQITVTHLPTEYVLTTVLTLEFTDEFATIEDIQPRSATILETMSGGTITELTVTTTDLAGPVMLAVDDPRFEIIGQTLILRAGEQLSPGTVRLRITAAEAGEGGQAMSVPFDLTVLEVPEAPQSIGLSSRSVVEWVRGDRVGTVTVNGQAIANRYVASVDDTRFEIVDGVLKLRDGDFLRRADQQEAEVVITVSDLDGFHSPYSESFIITVRENSNPFHNPAAPLDVNGDGEITPLDALLILNAISQNPGVSDISAFPTTGYYWDVNGDGDITPLDALIILNYLNTQQNQPFIGPEAAAPTVPESEGDADDASLPDDTLHVNPVPTIDDEEKDRIGGGL